MRSRKEIQESMKKKAINTEGDRGFPQEGMFSAEKGKKNPSLKLAHKIAKVLHTTIYEMFIFVRKEK